VRHFDKDDAKDLKADKWMLDLLKLNPAYTSWGPYEDYMRGPKDGWNSPQFRDGWESLDFGLDDLNEVVNFYFEIERANKPCVACDSSGQNPATKKIADDYYDFDNTGRRWRDNITQEEVEALQAKGRLCSWDAAQKKRVPLVVTAEQVNEANRRGGLFGELVHDSINCWILVEARARRLGVYGNCAECRGSGHIYTEPKAHVNLILWVLHPRKGCSRGVEVKNITRKDLPKVFAYLKRAAQRNANRFRKVVRA
jgi:hypothetical protein